MSWMKIKCGHCGLDADINEWTTTPIYGQLPPGHFQCPGCGVAIKRKIGESEVLSGGYVIPGKTTITPVQGSL